MRTKRERQTPLCSRKNRARGKVYVHAAFLDWRKAQEACELRLDNIGQDKIRVRGKGQKVREIGPPPEIMEVINR
ncbi:hypothetical protein [Thermoplasma acidophilum]|uniref:hypothetical protein n=1 Tax=Thermoplasma acidophilum TaxID=2303 RepID=UPI00064F2080|nr:hypothetical protein [Thermoplasma acidophilum]MCY0851143.1 hypothetical protein [Thermoplasma acidophilum]